MSNHIKLSGLNYKTLMLKIPKGINYPFQFEVEFKQSYSEEEQQAYIANNLKMQLHLLSKNIGEVPISTFSPIKVGDSIVFLVDTGSFDELSKKALLDTANSKDSKFADRKTELTTEADRVDDEDNIFLAKIVEGRTEKNDFFVEKQIQQFSFQVIRYDDKQARLVQAAALGQLERLPESLKEVEVSLKPSAREFTADKELWKLIKDTTTAISYNSYEMFMNGICGTGQLPYDKNELNDLSRKRFLPFTDTDSYRTVKVLTEFFLLVNCAAKVENMKNYRVEVHDSVNDINSKIVYTLPFYQVIRNRFPELRLKVKGIGDILDMFSNPKDAALPDNCYGILQDSLSEPCFLELIWSYWHEEAMLVQALNAISLRFQNRKSLSRSKDPLASMEISHLKPLNNLLWGYIQDEQHRLTVVRRAYEYDHHYGITLQGKAVPDIQGADSRKNFLEAFHMLLYRCILFYKQDDDLTVKADAFPILNALKEVHYILSEGMHNQYGDLPFTARVEMLSQQWLLARPELREFLPTRAMVAYPENWMGPIAAMNNIQGWTGTSPTYFNMLAVYGEMLFLSVRFGNWSATDANSDQATNWAREFRSEIQGYIHAYRTVTGVDLTAPHPQTGKIDSRQPSFHLAQRAKASLNGSSNGNGQVKVSANGKSTVGY